MRPNSSMLPDSTVVIHAPVFRICARCGGDFAIERYKLKRKVARYCSLACWHAIRSERIREHVIARFWSSVHKNGDCWLWTGRVTKEGFGALTSGNKNITAHRFSYELAHGPVSPGLFVLRCSKHTLCVNPAHLTVSKQANPTLNENNPRHGKGLKPQTIASFWARVEQTDDHWWWRGTFIGGAYGRLGHRLAHHIAYELAYGPIPEGLDVLHSCDTPPCVNPAHLFAGTHKENMADMAAKGRAGTARGERNYLAKLTDDQVREIYRRARKSAHHRRAEGESQTALAQEFGVSLTTVNKIVRGHTWRHLALCG